MCRSRSRSVLVVSARLVFLAAFLGVAVPAVAQTESTSGQPDFTPSISFMGALESNPGRVPGDTEQTQFFSAVGELPFRLRSPRWNFSLVYRPEYQYNRDDETLTSFDHSGSFVLRGQLSPRTDLEVEGDAYASNDLRGLDANDVLVPRTRRIRGTVDAELRQQLSTRGTLRVRGGYERLAFPDGELVDSDSGYAGLSYGHAMSTRLTLSLGGRVRTASFDSGSKSRSLSASVGGLFQLARRTDLEINGGILWIQEDNGTGWQRVEQPGYGFRAQLRHDVDRVSFRLVGERDLGTSSGLGRATLRDRVVGSAGWSDNRLGLLGLAGYSRNRGFGTEEIEGPVIETLSVCGRAAVRVSRVVAVVGALSYAHQLGEIIEEATDTYRVSLGVRLQANALPLASAASSSEFRSIGRTARAAC